MALAGCAAQTEPASNVGSSSATLNAHGFTGSNPAHAFFQYSTAKIALGTGFGLQTPTLNFGPNLSGPFTASVSGLSPGSNYFFRVCGSDVGDQPFCNADLEFTTTVPGAVAAFGPPLVAAGYSVLAIGDFNGDGLPDLVVFDSSVVGRVDVLLNNGDGTFTETSTLDIGRFTLAVAVGDFNRDGNIDLLAASGTSGTGQSQSEIKMFPGRGDGTFGAPIITTAPAVANFTWAVAADFNRDGKLDIALLSEDSLGGSALAQVMIGNGNGTFQPADQSLRPGGGTGAWEGLVVGDFNGDGKPDLALPNPQCTAPSVCGVSVLLGNGDGTFGPEHVYDAGTDAFGLVSGALHGGSRLDLIAEGTGGITVLNGNGDGTFAVGAHYGLKPDLLVRTADINGDGKLDLVTSAGDAAARKPIGTDVWLGNGDGTFQNPITSSPCVPTSLTSATVVADFNGDGKPDISCSVPDASGTTAAVILNATPPAP